MVIAVTLAAPAAAEQKKSKQSAKPAETMSEAQKTNDASWRLVKGSLPIFLPSWSLPIYMQVQGNQEKPATAKTKKAKAKAKPAQQ
jgi:hypothetical protein